MAENYLLKVEESAGEHSFVTDHLIEAEDRQMVKYHYHRTLKDWGYRPTAFDKHNLSRGEIAADIFSIKKLDRGEADILSKHLTNWVKV